MATEHAVFKFEDLKVNSRDGRQTDSQNEKHKVWTLAANAYARVMKSTKCGPSHSCTLMVFLMHFKKLSDTHEIIHKVCRNH